MVCVCKCVGVRGCAYASESVGGCAAKNGKARKVLLVSRKYLKRSRKGEAAIKSRMVCVNSHSQNNLLR